MKSIGTLLCVLVMVVGLSVSAHAALVDMGDGTIYDTDTELSWLKDAGMSGLKTWADAVSWADSLNVATGFGGLSGWRLPATAQPDGSCSNQENPGGGFPLQGWGYDCTSEMAHLYYVTLGNTAGGPLGNTGAFTNVQGIYWSGTGYAPDSAFAWFFEFIDGSQYMNAKGLVYYAWAVRPGARSTTNPHFIDMGDGTIYDTQAKLSWMKDAGAGGVKTLAEAETWVSNLNTGGGYAGLTNWRIPSTDDCTGYNCTNTELGKLYDSLGNIAGGPLVNTGAFTNVAQDYYWQSGPKPDTDYKIDFSERTGYQFGTKGAPPLGSLGRSAAKLAPDADTAYVWAVSSGDRLAAPASTPVPATGTGGLIILGLAGLMLLYGRRLKSSTK
jgi:hypothetical protein